MSGHSHFSSIKHKKALTDAKRGRAFSKMTRVLSIAAKDGGDPTANAKLRIAIEQAKSLNMPKDTIERAIKKGAGELGGEGLEEFLFEAYGPGKTAIIIEGITDNKNRTLGEIKQILNQYNGKLASEGSVKWMFERKGVITLRIINPVRNQKNSNGAGEYEYTNKDDLELKIIEAEAEDFYWHDDILDVFTKPESLEKVKKNLEEKGLLIESAGLGWVAKEQVEVENKEKESLEKLFESLDENESVQDIYSNLRA